MQILIPTFQKILTLPRTTWLGLGMASLGMLVTISGFVLLAISSRQVSAQVVVPPEVKLGVLMVDVGGAVVQPGIYQLNTGDRWAQAISQAGGLLPQASTSFISQQMNLAANLKDGDKIYIPFEDEVIKTPEEPSLELEASQSSTTGLSINSATVSELDSLPGIGAARAEAIVENRPYSAIQELVEREVISEAVFEQIKSLIGV